MEDKDEVKLNISHETKAVMAAIPVVAKENLEKFLTSNPYPFYGLLLGRSIDKFLADYVANNWLDLHYMSGEDCLLLSVHAPEKADAEVVNYWKKKLKGELEGIWENMPKAAWSYNYARMLGVDYDKLPRLFLGTDLNANTGIIAKIPEWGEQDLFKLFEFVFQKAHESSGLSPTERLLQIERDIENLYMAKLGRIYIKDHWMEFAKPKEIIGSIIEVLTAAVIAGAKKGVGVP